MNAQSTAKPKRAVTAKSGAKVAVSVAPSPHRRALAGAGGAIFLRLHGDDRKRGRGNGAVVVAALANRRRRHAPQAHRRRRRGGRAAVDHAGRNPTHTPVGWACILRPGRCAARIGLRPPAGAFRRRFRASLCAPKTICIERRRFSPPNCFCGRLIVESPPCSNDGRGVLFFVFPFLARMRLTSPRGLARRGAFVFSRARMSRLILGALSIVGALWAVGCGGGGSDSSPIPPPPPLVSPPPAAPAGLAGLVALAADLAARGRRQRNGEQSDFAWQHISTAIYRRHIVGGGGGADRGRFPRSTAISTAIYRRQVVGGGEETTNGRFQFRRGSRAIRGDVGFSAL